MQWQIRAQGSPKRRPSNRLEHRLISGQIWALVSTQVLLGLPLAGYNATTGAALEEQLATRLRFVTNVLGPAIEEATNGALAECTCF